MIVVVTQMSLDSEKSFDRIGFVVVLPIALFSVALHLEEPPSVNGGFSLVRTISVKRRRAGWASYDGYSASSGR